MLHNDAKGAPRRHSRASLDSGTTGVALPCLTVVGAFWESYRAYGHYGNTTNHGRHNPGRALSAIVTTMPRKLKTYQTSQGFYDLAVATPSMKAALEAWGSKQNLFHQGFAKETDDSEVVAAAMAKPGVVVRRPVGPSSPFASTPICRQLSP
jgi:hypothetical protein